MSQPGQMVRLFGPEFELRSVADQFHCVSLSSLRSFLLPGAVEFNLPRGRWRKGPGSWAPLLVNPKRALILSGWIRRVPVLWDLDSGTELYREDDICRFPSASKDGRYCAFVGEQQTKILKATSGELVMTTPLGQRKGVFTKDAGFYVGFADERIEGYNLKIEPKFTIANLEKKSFRVYAPADNPSDFRVLQNELVIHHEDRTLSVVDLESAEPTRKHSGRYDGLFDATGDRLLVSRVGDALVLDARDFKHLRTIRHCRNGRFSNDGEWLATHIEEEQHLLRVFTPSGELALESVLRDPAFAGHDSELSAQLCFDENSKQLAVLVNGEMFRSWGFQDGRWRARCLDPQQLVGEDTYLGVETTKRVVGSALSALKSLGRAVRRSKPMGTTGQVSLSEPLRQSIDWIRRRREQLRKRWPHALPRPFTEHNNRALSVRNTLEKLEPYLTMVETKEPPYNVSAFAFGELLESLTRGLRDTSPAGRQLHPFLDHLSFLDLKLREQVLHFYENSDEELLAPIAERYHTLRQQERLLQERVRQRREDARDAVDVEAELTWILPLVESKASLNREQLQFVRSRLRESNIRAACADTDTSRNRVSIARYILQTSLHSSTDPPPPELAKKLTGAFRLDLKLHECKRCEDLFTSAEIKHNSICWGCWGG